MFFLRLLGLSAPLFGLVLLGALIAAVLPWERRWTTWLNRFVFAVPLPVLLFRAVSRAGGETQADPRLLVAFFGSCFLVFGLGGWLARAVLRVSAADSALLWSELRPCSRTMGSWGYRWFTCCSDLRPCLPSRGS